MAQVKWTDEADALFDKYIMNAFVKSSYFFLSIRVQR